MKDIILSLIIIAFVVVVGLALSGQAIGLVNQLGAKLCLSSGPASFETHHTAR